jgi:hypothetical protein
MAQCVICKRENAVSAPVMQPTCPTCGITAGKVEASLDQFALKLGQIGDQKLGGEPVAAEILRIVGDDDKVGKARLRRTLKVILALHACADWIGNALEEAPAAKRTARAAAIDHALRFKGLDSEGQEIMGSTNHAHFGASRQRLVDHCQQGWNTIKAKWGELPQQEKRHYVSVVLEHDKGYPQSVQGAENYSAPGSVGVEELLMKILFSSGNTSPFTSMPSAQTREFGAHVKAGWTAAKEAERNMMWFTLLTRIGSDLNSTDPGVIIGKLKASRREVVDLLAEYVPRQAAEQFVDKGAQAAWDAFM